MTGPIRLPPSCRWETVIACLVAFGCAAGWASATNVLYEADFELPDALAGWDLQSTGQGVIERRAFDGEPDTWLLLHDGVDDAEYSYNTASFTVSVNRMTDLALSFAARSFDAEAHAFDDGAPGFDGVTLELTVGETVHTRRVVDGVFDAFHAFDLNTLGFPGTPRFYRDLTVRFHQYGNGSAPGDGIAIDDIRVTGRPYRYIIIEAPAEIEEAVGTIDLTVALQPPPTEEQAITVELPGTGQEPFVTAYPAGAPAVFFAMPFPDDDLANRDRIQVVQVLCEGYDPGTAEMLVIDEEMHRVSLRFSGDLVEGDADARGSVRLTYTATEPTPILLSSSNPSALSVPATVVVDAARSGASFSAAVPEDDVHRPNQLVTITAVLPGEHTNTLTVSVVDNDAIRLTLAGPMDAMKGNSGLVYRIDLGARLDDDLDVDVQSTPAGELLHPPTVTVPAGAQFAEFFVSVSDGQVAVSNRFVVLRIAHPAYGNHQIPVELHDNTLAGYAIGGMPQLVAGGIDRPFEVRGVDLDGEPIPYYHGAIEVSLVDSEGTETTLYPGPVSIANGVFAGTFRTPPNGSDYRIRVRDAAGHTAESFPFDLYYLLPFDAKDLVYDPVSARLYVTAGAEAPPGHANAVTPINPAAGTLGDPLYVGSELGRIEVTDGGEYLYVVVNGQRAVRRIELQAFTLDMLITLTDINPIGYSFVAFDLLTFPGRPLDVMVAQGNVSTSYTVSPIYFNGVMQPAHVSDAWQLVPAGDPNQFYAYNSMDTGYDFWRMELTGDGYQSVAKVGGLISGFRTLIEGEGDLVFTTAGSVIDGLRMTRIGILPFPSAWGTAAAAIAPDLSQARVCYAKGKEIASFETIALARLAVRQLEDIAGNITRMVRWGPHGLAMLTDKQELIILESASFLPSGDSTDLGVTVSPSRNPAEYGVSLSYEVTVENHGPMPAEHVVLSLDMGDAQEVLSVTANFGRITTDGALLQVTHDVMGVGEQMRVTIEAIPTALKPLRLRAGVILSRRDDNPANNDVSSVVSVGYATAPDSVRVLEVNSDAVLWEPVSERLLFDQDNGAGEYQILSLDPLTGLVDHAHDLQEVPGPMAVSDDGQYLYIGIRSPAKVIRVNLDTWESDLDFASTAPEDIAVLPGSPRTVIVGSGWDGVRIYDDGVQRPDTSGTYHGTLVEVSPDPAVIYAYNSEDTGFETFRLGVDASGVRILDEIRELISGFSLQMKSDGRYLYTSTGLGVDADLLLLDGTFLPRPSGTVAVEPERARQRVYFGMGTGIRSYDARSYMEIRTASFPELPDTITALERWGADGFAARLRNGYIAAIRTSLIPRGNPSGVDLVVDVPIDGQVVPLPEITVRGGAWSPQGVSQVLVNGAAADSADGYQHWSHPLVLSPGTNHIEVVAAGIQPGSGIGTNAVMVIYDPRHDGDGDGIADAWELAHFPTKAVEDILPDSDADGDSSTLLQEFLFGQEPGVSDQPFVIRLEASEPATVLLGHARLRDAPWTYHLEYAVEPDVWHDAAAILQPAGPPVVLPGARHERVTYTLTPAAPRHADFRVRVAPAP